MSVTELGSCEHQKVWLVKMAKVMVLGIENAWQPHLDLKLKDQKPVSGEKLVVQAL